ncbi:XRE family transcriptional regulator [Bacillus subtilis]|nr:XRE family transcriptional regulator [Bacillus subtilis]
MKLYPFYDGDLKDFIRIRRAYKNISSTKLSEMLGKNRAYISQIENGHNKNPDYETMYKAFKILGVDEKDIENYLYNFNILSPEYMQHLEDVAIGEMERPDEYYIAKAEEYEREIEENFIAKNKAANDGFDLFKEMSDVYIGEIHRILKDIFDEPSGKGFEIVDGLNKLTGEMIRNEKLFNFTSKLFNSDLQRLDEQGMLKVLNTVIEETNRINKEKTAFGKPKIIKPIKSLD